MADATLSGPGGSFDAVVAMPGDKSLSHRALLFAAMAEGDSLVQGRGTGADVRSTEAALRVLGVQIDGEQVRSPGMRNWTTPDAPIDCGNSGTTMRLLAGALSTSSVTATLVGDASLSARPMGRLVGPLRAVGGVIETTQGSPPLTVGGNRSRRPRHCLGASAVSGRVRRARRRRTGHDRISTRIPGPHGTMAQRHRAWPLPHSDEIRGERRADPARTLRDSR